MGGHAVRITDDEIDRWAERAAIMGCEESAAVLVFGDDVDMDAVYRAWDDYVSRVRCSACEGSGFVDNPRRPRYEPRDNSGLWEMSCPACGGIGRVDG